MVTRRQGDPFPETDTDWDLVNAMSDEEITRRALDDPDNPPVDTIEHRLRRVVNVRRLREGMGLSLDAFAGRYDLPVALVQGWEENPRIKDPAARRLLEAIEREPETMARLLSPAA
ncbi:MAG: hypothetical protein RLY86_2079 [Pseudomonadota bacterium]|jgi:putative transcriptional regulator